MDLQEAPPLPRYDLPKAVKLRDKLYHITLAPFFGFRPEGEAFDDFVRTLAKEIKAPDKAVYESVRHLAGQVLTDKVLFETSWRLAGNRNALKAGEPARPWSGPSGDPAWMPCHVLQADKDVTPRGEPAVSFQVQVLAGPACPLKTRVFWTKKFARMVACNVGFTAPFRDRPFRDVRELTSLRMYLLLDPEKTVRDKLAFTQVRCPTSLLNWNLKIINMRTRRDYDCPYGFDHACFECPAGYAVPVFESGCPAACRRLPIIAQE